MRMLIVLLIAFLTAACSGSGDAPVLRFSAIPDQNTTLLREKFDPVAKYLSAELGIAVEYVPARDYQASVELFENGDIHMAWFGGLTGVQARENVDGARAIAQGKEDLAFHSYFIAHRDTGLTRSDEFPAAIANLAFTFGSASSTSGRLMPEHFLTTNSGMSAEAFFAKTPSYSKSHDQTAELVQSGAFQAGVLNYQVYESRVKDGRTDPEICRVIWKTPSFADYNITVRPDIDAVFGKGVTEKLTKAMLGMDDPALLASFGRSAIVPASNEDYAGLRKVAQDLGMLR